MDRAVVVREGGKERSNVPRKNGLRARARARSGDSALTAVFRRRKSFTVAATGENGEEVRSGGWKTVTRSEMVLKCVFYGEACVAVVLED